MVNDREIITKLTEAIKSKQPKLSELQMSKINAAIDAGTVEQIISRKNYQTIAHMVQEITDDNKSSETLYASVLAIVTFVNKVVEEKQLSSIPNVTYHGLPTIQGYQVSNFSDTNYLQMPTVIDLNVPFEINFSFTTGADVTTPQYLIGSHCGLGFAITANSKINIMLSFSGDTWDVDISNPDFTIQPNTTYFIKINMSKNDEDSPNIYKVFLSENEDAPIEDWVLLFTIENESTLYPTPIYLGNNYYLNKPFKGSINFRYCNVILTNSGIVMWDGMGREGLLTKANVNLDNLTSVGIQRIRDIVQPLLDDYVLQDDIKIKKYYMVENYEQELAIIQEIAEKGFENMLPALVTKANGYEYPSGYPAILEGLSVGDTVLAFPNISGSSEIFLTSTMFNGTLTEYLRNLKGITPITVSSNISSTFHQHELMQNTGLYQIHVNSDYACYWDGDIRINDGEIHIVVSVSDTTWISIRCADDANTIGLLGSTIDEESRNWHSKLIPLAIIVDDEESNNTTWSSEKIAGAIPSKLGDLTNDKNFITPTDYASTAKGGTIKLGNKALLGTDNVLYCATVFKEDVKSANNKYFVSIGTLLNLITKNIMAASDDNAIPTAYAVQQALEDKENVTNIEDFYCLEGSINSLSPKDNTLYNIKNIQNGLSIDYSPSLFVVRIHTTDVAPNVSFIGNYTFAGEIANTAIGANETWDLSFDNGHCVGAKFVARSV